ncbi:hypothetical protein AWENTII_004543 [Aspergillus wentii]
MAAPIQLDRIPPTTTAYVIATAIIAGVTGYFIGQGSSLGLFKEKEGWPNSYDVKVHKDSSDEEEEDSEEEEYDSEDDSEEEGDGGELSNFKDNNEEVKLVLVVRTDLGMTKGTSPIYYDVMNARQHSAILPTPTQVSHLTIFIGKIAAQCSHATLACYKYFLTHAPDSPILRRWERQGQAKIALQLKSEEELQLLQAQAMSLGLCARVIQDAGRTQIASGSRTVLGVLGPKSVVDNVTGHLKLL